MRQGIVTLSDLIADGRHLEIGCLVCRLHVYIDPGILAVPMALPVPDICDLLKCPQCGAENAEPGNPLWARPDARPPKMGAMDEQGFGVTPMGDPYKDASMFMSLLLRHDPGAGGLCLDDAGWTSVDALLRALKAKGHRLDRAQLNDLVATNVKARFAFDETGNRIRAVQGHSIDVSLGYDPAIPPDWLYHGTVARFMPSIRAHGLRSQARTHVHLSCDVETAVMVGRRRGTPVVLTIDAAAMHADGFEFFVADNGVWLTCAVTVHYIVDWGGAAEIA